MGTGASGLCRERSGSRERFVDRSRADLKSLFGALHSKLLDACPGLTWETGPGGSENASIRQLSGALFWLPSLSSSSYPHLRPPRGYMYPGLHAWATHVRNSYRNCDLARVACVLQPDTEFSVQEDLTLVRGAAHSS